jgi:membrane protein implicated in regulation of membrane protease activity
LKRWVFVGGVGVVCGLLLGWLLWSLTASVAAALLVGIGVAAILLVLAWGGARHNETPDRAAEAAAKRRRVQEAIRETRGEGS